jgi:hypothetical protein
MEKGYLLVVRREEGRGKQQDRAEGISLLMHVCKE